jgi:hypothetical protein
MGDCLLWADQKNKNISPFFGYFFPWLRLSIDLDKKWLGQHIGLFFSQTHLINLSENF